MRKRMAWVGASSDFDRAWCCAFMRYHADASRLASVRQACRVNVHVHTLKDSKAKGLCQLVSRNDPQSRTLASTQDRVERSSSRRNRIKSGIATRFETLGV